MSTNTYIAIGVVALVVLGGVFLLQSGSLPQAPGGPLSEEQETGTQPEEAGVAVPRYMVAYTNEGFTPVEITIQQGESVVFQNQSAGEMWPASALHPTHEVYPGSGIEKCGGPEEGRIFDACQAHREGESFSFNFQEVGTWPYHNHLNPNHFGRVIVE